MSRVRFAAWRFENIESLAVMYAQRLEFPGSSFYVVVAQYVVTAIPDPEAGLNEFLRVLRPGGEIVLLSRVGAEDGVRHKLEHWFAPVAGRLGWRTEFPWSRYQRWVTATAGVSVVEQSPIPPLGHFSLIRFAKDKTT